MVAKAASFKDIPSYLISLKFLIEAASLPGCPPPDPASFIIIFVLAVLVA